MFGRCNGERHHLGIEEFAERFDVLRFVTGRICVGHIRRDRRLPERQPPGVGRGKIEEINGSHYVLGLSNLWSGYTNRNLSEAGGFFSRSAPRSQTPAFCLRE